MKYHSGMAATVVVAALAASTVVSAQTSSTKSNQENPTPPALGAQTDLPVSQVTEPSPQAPPTQAPATIEVQNGNLGDPAGNNVLADAEAQNGPKAGQVTGQARGQSRDRAERVKLEKEVRLLMVKYGFAAQDTQNALIDFISKDERDRMPLRQTAVRLVRALNESNIPDDKMRTTLTRYHYLVKADRERREKAQAALDARIRYSENPRLEAILLLSGVIGEGKFMILPAPPPPPAPAPLFAANEMERPEGTNRARGGAGVGGMVRAGGMTGDGRPGGVPGLVQAGAVPAVNPTLALPISIPPSRQTTLAMQPPSTAFGVAGRNFATPDPFAVLLHNELVKRFDKNRNTQIDAEESAQAMSYFQAALKMKDSREVFIVTGSNTNGTELNSRTEIKGSVTSTTTIIETHSMANMPPKQTPAENSREGKR